MRWWLVLSILLSSWLLGSCNRDPVVTADDAIQQRLDKEIATFKATLSEQCRAKALEAAGLQADSILLEIARRRLDTLSRPQRIPKPDKPEQRPLRDTLQVAPFLHDTIQ